LVVFKSKFTPPQVYYGIFRGKYYVTISDSESVYKFASSRKQVHAAVKSKCIRQLDPTTNMYVYMIDGTSDYTLQVISCRVPTAPVDSFVIKHIIPIVFPNM
jgi:hypothetical protein